MGPVALLWNQRPEIPTIIIPCMQDIQGGEKPFGSIKQVNLYETPKMTCHSDLAIFGMQTDEPIQ